jgi:predicted NUDIX family phosphoesterase
MEFVFVVPRQALFPAGAPQGFVPFGAGLSRAQFLETIQREGFFVERPKAELEPAWKQIIPYALITQARRVLLLERTKKGGDARLHGKLSIGVGGHLNLVDQETPNGPDRSGIAQRGAQRELAEELEPVDFGPVEELGLINDDSNPVGSVHLGLVLSLEALGPVRIREAEVLKGRLVEQQTLQELVTQGANLETWSKLLLPLLQTRLAAVRPGAYRNH